MDENVDEIILILLRDLKVEIPEEQKSLKGLSPALFYSAVVKCVRAIDPSIIFNSKLPDKKASQITVCQKVAEAIVKLGYDGEITSSQFIYPEEKVTRQLFIWFNQHVKTKEDQVGKNSIKGEQVLFDSISSELNNLNQEIWLPPFFSTFRRSYEHSNPFITHSLNTGYLPPSQNFKPQQTYVREILPYVTEQPPVRNLIIPSIIEMNTSKVVEEQEREEIINAQLSGGMNPGEYKKKKLASLRNSMANSLQNALSSFDPQQTFFNQSLRKGKMETRFSRQVEMQDKTTSGKKGETEEELEEKRRQTLEQYDNKLQQMLDAINKIKQEMEGFINKFRQIEAEKITEGNKTALLKDEFLVKKAVIDLLPEAANNILKLQEISQSNAGKLMELAKEWEKVRTNLINQYRDLRSKFADRKKEAKEKLNKIKEMREQMERLRQEMQQKDQKYRQLLEQYKKVPKDKTRAMYTERILEIVKNLKKQKLEIDKILQDTKELKKEINKITDKLNRSFSVTDEMIFKDAKKDMTAKQAYKYLVDMNEKFNTLTELVSQTGTVRNEALDLEIKIDQLNERTKDLDVNQVENDLSQIKEENSKLMLQFNL